MKECLKYMCVNNWVMFVDRLYGIDWELIYGLSNISDFYKCWSGWNESLFEVGIGGNDRVELEILGR